MTTPTRTEEQDRNIQALLEEVRKYIIEKRLKEEKQKLDSRPGTTILKSSKQSGKR